MQRRVRFRIYGKVQGVFFRAFVQEKAKELGVTGFVTNGENNTVEGVMEGTKEAIERMIACCRRGPPGAYVEKVEVHEETGKEGRGIFKVKY